MPLVAAIAALGWAGFAPLERAFARRAVRDSERHVRAAHGGRQGGNPSLEIRLTLGLNDVLLLRNLDDVPQVFGPSIMMPGQSFRLPFEKAAEYQFACTAHASGQMTSAGGAVPGDAVVEDSLARS